MQPARRGEIGPRQAVAADARQHFQRPEQQQYQQLCEAEREEEAMRREEERMAKEAHGVAGGW